MRSPLARVIPPSTLSPAWTPGPAALFQLVQSPQVGHHRSTDVSVYLPRRPCSCGSGTNAKSEGFSLYCINFNIYNVYAVTIFLHWYLEFLMINNILFCHFLIFSVRSI